MRKAGARVSAAPVWRSVRFRPENPGRRREIEPLKAEPHPLGGFFPRHVASTFSPGRPDCPPSAKTAWTCRYPARPPPAPRIRAQCRPFEHPVQFGDARFCAHGLLPLTLFSSTTLAPPESPFPGPWPGGKEALLQRVPLPAGGTLPQPFGAFVAAGAAYKRRFRLCHGSPHQSMTAYFTMSTVSSAVTSYQYTSLPLTPASRPLE